MDRRQTTGKAGETIARVFLERLGWKILHTNWRSRIGEIDIVAEQPGEPFLVIIEVRTKRSHKFGTAAESINCRKQQRLRRLAQQYVIQHRIYEKPLRFDVITVSYVNEGRSPEVTHIPAAF